jgi:hypothetical protein
MLCHLFWSFWSLLTLLHYSIFQIPKLGTKLKQDSMPLSYTPRKFIPHPANRFFYMIEADHRVAGDEAVRLSIDDLVSLSFCFHYWLHAHVPIEAKGY